ncbi:MAG: hypothetical protein JO316_08125 [Abitibacteriaceae bacterium]|nr:hypothetical protein [Abditibacteriaceae bacterium]
MTSHSSARGRISAVFLLIFLVTAFSYLKQRFVGNTPLRPVVSAVFRPVKIDTPSNLATWPWPKAKRDTPHRGVTHWITRDGDATVVEFFDFDFGTNPNLRFEIFDQDEIDQTPFDNKVDFWALGVGQAVRHLNTQFAAAHEGKVLAAWNGLFFGYDRKSHNRYAFHVAPVVLRGKVYYPGKNHRWTFGVKYQHGHPVFKTFFLPDPQTMAREFDYAAGSAQCLIKDGKPLKVQPFPPPGATPVPQPIKSTAEEAGYIPDFDHMKSCRASLGWSKDNRHLYLLFVKESDSESGSIQALHYGMPMGGGWMVSDVQHFWQAFGVPNAINSDAGDAAQLACLRADGKYDLVPPRLASSVMRMTFTPEFKGAPAGGAMMYLYVRDSHG